MSTEMQDLNVPINEEEPEEVKPRISVAESQTDPDDPKNEYSKTIEEPEDNDGEKRHPKPEDRVSLNGTIVSIVKSCIGAGVLNMPITIQAFGFIPSLFVFISEAGITTRPAAF